MMLRLHGMRCESSGALQTRARGHAGRGHLDGVLDLLLQLIGNVIAVRDVPDARQRCRLGVGLVERREPEPAKPNPASEAAVHACMHAWCGSLVSCSHGNVLGAQQAWWRPGGGLRPRAPVEQGDECADRLRRDSLMPLGPSSKQIFFHLKSTG